MNVAAPDKSSTALSALSKLLGSRGYLDQAEDMQKYVCDWYGRSRGEALAVVRPTTTEEVVEIVNICGAANIGLVPQGGNTGLVHGGIPTEQLDCIVISMDRMTSIRSIDPDNFTMVAEAGCIVQKVQEAAAEVGRLYPLSLSSQGSSTVGGTISTNAGGNNTLRFGNAREQVLGLEVVLADGTIFDGLNTLRKNNTGYDLKQLFIGGEGTLGIITAAAVRLMPGPKQMQTALLAVTDPSAAQKLLSRSREVSGDLVLAFELMPRTCLDIVIKHIDGVSDPLDSVSPWYVLIELSTSSEVDDLRAKLDAILEESMTEGWVTDGVIAESEQQRATLWRIREEQAEAGKREGRDTSADVSVPVSQVAEFLKASMDELETEVPGVRLSPFGHMGDGNIHYVIYKPAEMADEVWAQRKGDALERVHQQVYKIRGSFSAEHGIGAMKREDLLRFAEPSRIAMMHAVKAAIDPNNIMNPGKVFK